LLLALLVFLFFASASTFGTSLAHLVVIIDIDPVREGVARALDIEVIVGTVFSWTLLGVNALQLVLGGPIVFTFHITRVVGHPEDPDPFWSVGVLSKFNVGISTLKEAKRALGE
jgi:hypothetical protein